MKSVRTKGRTTRASSSRPASSQTSLSQYFPVIRSPVQSQPVLSSQPTLDNNSSTRLLRHTTEQLSIKNFIFVSTPSNHTTSSSTPQAPLKSNVDITLRETVQPRKLDYPVNEDAITIQTTQHQLKYTQRKITSFFTQRPRKATLITAAPAGPTNPPLEQIVGFRRSRRSLLRHNLIKYNYHPTSSSRSLYSFLTFAPPATTLYDSWGHSLPMIDPSKVFRVFLQNPNGLRFSGATYALQNDLRICHDYGAAALCLPETNVNWKLPHQREAFSGLLRKTWRNSSFSASPPPEEFLSSHQPGGTATVICDNWTSRLIDRGEDPVGLGRWSYITLRGKGSAKVTIVTAYNATQSDGDTTNYQQQYRVLSRMYREQGQQVAVNPRRQFILDFQAWLETCIADGQELIIGMDANDSYNPDTTGVPQPLDFSPDQPTVSRIHNGKLSTLIATCGLRDPLALQHSNRPFPASHIRGSKRIDHILVTPRLVSAVISSGSLAFHSLFHSDHRAYYIDLDSMLLFADPAFDIAPCSYRKLRLSDPRLKNQYRDLLHKQLVYHKVYDKIQTLQEVSDDKKWTSAHTEDYQKLDKVITEAMLYAESNTGKRFSTRYEWSPTLKKAVQAFRFWQLRYRQARHLGISLPRLAQLQAQAEISDEEAEVASVPAILLRLQQAADILRQHQRQHVELRTSHLVSLAKAIVLDRSPNLSHASVSHIKEERVTNQVRQLIKRENLRRMFRKIKRILNPVEKQGLSRIDVPDSSARTEAHGDPSKPKEWKGPWVSLTKPSDIANIIKAINKQQYHQAHETPFGTGPIASSFGRLGDTTAANRVLGGDIPEELQQAPMMAETRRILHTMATAYPAVQDASGVVTKDEFVSAYAVSKESTSSSPSGRHIGHYKAAVTDPTLATLHSQMMSFPFVHGFAPDRWKRVTDIMLEKEQGNSRCHRLRILALFEKDFNQAKRIVIGRRLMHHLEDFDMLSPMQDGSRPGRQCISAVLKKTLAHDYVRLTATTAAFIENDAIGCYDRLVNNLILMLLKKLGLPPTVSRCMGELWDKVVHLIKTVYGISDITYGSTPECPLYGPGQGSTCGPLFWLLCYWIIVESIDPNISSMKFLSACRSVMVEVFGASFVDDSSLGVLSDYQYDPIISVSENREREVSHVVSQLSVLAQHWERLLYSTGGAINMQKSHWYLISWIWNNGVPRLATIRNSPAGMALTTGHNEVQEVVPRVEPTQAFRTLGVYLAGLGKQTKQATILRSYSDQYKDSLVNAYMSPPEAYWSYLLFLRPKLTYPLPVCSLTQKQCRVIQAPALAALLPKLHLNRHSPRAVLFGGLKYGGLELPELYTDQGYGQLRLLIGHLKLRDEVGLQILCFLSELQLFIGSHKPVFSLSYPVYGQWVGDFWLVSIWRHLSQINFLLEIEEAWCPVLPRQFDDAIMDVAICFPFTSKQLQEINSCRLFLQVLTISDIADAQGIRLLKSAYLGLREDSRPSSLHWPSWQRPTTWTAWRLFLQHISNGGRLLRELGKWVQPSHQQWQWYYDASQDVVYHVQAEDSWVKYSPAPSQRSTRRSSTVYTSPIVSSPHTFPQLLFPTTVTFITSTTIRSIHSAYNFAERVHKVSPSIWEPTQIPPELSDTPIFYQRIIGPTPPTAFQCTELATVLQNEEELLCCSDGSYVDDTGASYHGWILASNISKTIAEGSGPGFGHPELLSSYRAELCGILALLYIMQRVCSHHRITSGSMRLFCDNKSALQQSTSEGPRGIKPFLSADYDLIALIRLQTTLLPISVVGEWVKGHYTGDRREYKHDLNERVDHLATTAIRSLPQRFHTAPTVEAPPGYRVRLSNRKGIIHSRYYHMLAQAHHSQSIIDYILSKTKWTMAVFNRVDWDSHHRAFRRLTRFQRISTTKMVHNLMNTNRQNSLLYGTSNSCPGCAAQEETFEHVIRCQFGLTTIARKDSLSQLENKLKHIGTPLPVIQVIMGGFKDWLDPHFPAGARSRPGTFGSILPVDVLLTQAYSDQYHTIGWYQFCLGHISKLWHRAVQAYLPRTQKHQPLPWGSNLVTALWQFTKSLWMHRNNMVHGSSAEEAARRILIGLQERVRQHYDSFTADNSYVLARHRHLFLSRTQDQRLSMSYDFLTCWLRSVDEAREQLVFHTASQQTAASRFFGPPPISPVQSTDTSDGDYIASSTHDSETTSLATASTQETTRTGSSVPTLPDTISWHSFSDGFDTTSDSSASTTSLLAPIRFDHQPSSLPPPFPARPIASFSSVAEASASDEDSLLGLYG